jgi:hypothetical protein
MSILNFQTMKPLNELPDKDQTVHYGDFKGLRSGRSEFTMGQ